MTGPNQHTVFSLRRFAVWFVLALLVPARLFARDVRVSVIDAELDMPLEGAIVRTPDGQDWECGPDGDVVVTVPDDAQLVIRAVYPGYETGRAVLPANADALTIPLALTGMMEGNELVIEAARPRASETVPGRSVALSGRELARTAEMGALEDVMKAIQLLPGVGYTGMSNGMPSIRGGFPGDLVAVFDGFYVENPYHFEGSVSIFDPRMIESAQLSHGIFSARHGHTISGILDVKSKKGDTELSYLELGSSTNAANLNVARPINDKGAFTVMLKSTYWAPVIWAAQWLSGYVDDEALDMVNSITTAPYILGSALSADYRWTPNLSASLNGYLGGDGAGAAYENPYEGDGYGGYTNIAGAWTNSLGFLTAGLLWNPRSDMVLGLRLGAGFNRNDIDGRIENSLTVPYTDEFKDEFQDKLNGKTDYTVEDSQRIVLGSETDNIQARLDYDWDWGNGFIFAAGMQELYSRWQREQSSRMMVESAFGKLGDKTLYINRPVFLVVDAANHAFSTSGYAIGEWTSPTGFLGTELGLRVDMFTFLGKDFSVRSAPAFNPRLNVDFHLIRNRAANSFIDSLTLTLGSGLFSSMTDNITDLEKGQVDDYELKPNRSWTSLAGININFWDRWTLNIETYYKYVFSRAYRVNRIDANSADLEPRYYFDGEGNVWGADLMLQKREGRFIDGWLSYTFTYARYRDPSMGLYANSDYRRDGYYPSFHRFHNLNLVLSIKPQNKFHIYVRYGIASGRPKPVVGEIDYYPVEIYDENNQPTGTIIQKFKRDSSYSDDSRTTLSMPFDVKFSWFFFNKQGRTTGEFYIAIENIASLFYLAEANTSFNQYTGKEDTGSTSASYEMPIPLPSLGIKWSF
ncbi:MAG: TonB-dependent receptor plug domain-containing protein [Spirochaetaceae bacterium]|jgi:hypothetical protein|nr:TonB-dependent receptor plug domain-containing protein [Spirochaetaceae bacterium]